MSSVKLKSKSSRISAKQPQRKYEYILPQDENAIKKETRILFISECISDLSQNLHLTYPQIEERAIEKCKCAKEICEYEEVCNDIEAFNKLMVQTYTENYSKLQLFYLANPQALETDFTLFSLHLHKTFETLTKIGGF